MNERKRIETANGEITLPEAIIQHIQSLLSRKEAAQTTVLSKSWYGAWLTRPDIDLDFRYFLNRSSSWDAFEESAKKTIKRYKVSGLKIESFRLRCPSYQKWARKLIVEAMKIGATDVDILMPSCTLPREVLGSQTLVKLSVSESSLEGWYASCSRLKSLSLKSVTFESDGEFKHMISCCHSLEELSLTYCFCIRFNLMNSYKLRRLSLYRVRFDSTFFNDFESRFPCLKDLSVLKCFGCERVHIASTSLETISFEIEDSWTATFDVSNIRKFTHSGTVLPRFSNNGASREWEFDLTIACNRFNNPSWFLNLKKLLAKFKLSRISLSINLKYGKRFVFVLEVDPEVVAEPLVLENLTINASASCCCALLVRLFGICRPKLLTLDWVTDKYNTPISILCKGLMSKELRITPDCGIPDRDMFGPFGLKKVNVEVYEIVHTERRPLLSNEPLDVSKPPPVNERKIQFELIWD